jgi:glycosyltransferase involved in cell wall biosynthesis
MKILFVVPYPTGKAPSQRFRFEQYYRLLESKGIHFDIKPFLSEAVWEILYKPGKFHLKAFGIFSGLLKRFVLLFNLKSFDYIFIHREATPIGPAFFEFIAARLLRKKIIYDFDDAIWIPNYSEANSFFSFLKGYKNVKHICGYAAKVSCGNAYLCEFARNYNAHVVYNPTTIDTHTYHNRINEHKQEKPVIGWTGSHSTIRYIGEILPVLRKLEKEFDFTFKVISDLKPDIELQSLEYCKWNKTTEIEDLVTFNIGIMPLKDDKWANGKCGFKALQYMALGIPALVSPVGVNSRIVDHGINGYVCHSDDDWETALRELLADRQRLIEMGKRTREKIEQHFSVQSNSTNFLALFSDAE